MALHAFMNNSLWTLLNFSDRIYFDFEKETVNKAQSYAMIIRELWIYLTPSMSKVPFLLISTCQCVLSIVLVSQRSDVYLKFSQWICCGNFQYLFSWLVHSCFHLTLWRDKSSPITIASTKPQKHISWGGWKEKQEGHTHEFQCLHSDHSHFQKHYMIAIVYYTSHYSIILMSHIHMHSHDHATVFTRQGQSWS